MSQGRLLQEIFTCFDCCDISAALDPLCWVEGTHPRARAITEFAWFAFETKYENKEAIYLAQLCYGFSAHAPRTSDAKDMSPSVVDEHIIDMVRSSRDPKRLANQALGRVLRNIQKASYLMIPTLLSCEAQFSARCDNAFGSGTIISTISALDRLAGRLMAGRHWKGTKVQHYSDCLLAEQILDCHLVDGEPKSNRSCLL